MDIESATLDVTVLFLESAQVCPTGYCSYGTSM